MTREQHIDWLHNALSYASDDRAEWLLDSIDWLRDMSDIDYIVRVRDGRIVQPK